MPGTPVPGTRVLLHRVGRQAQGVVDSTRTDARGRFWFGFRPDTSALYLVSARHLGIEYFSPPVHTNPARPDTGLTLVVSDTSSAAPVEVEARHLVIPRPGPDGARVVLDLLVLRNPSRFTRVARDSLAASFEVPLPPGTVGLEAAEGDFSPAALERQGDRLRVLAPISPGEKQVTVEYVLPGDRDGLELPIERPVGAVNVLAEEPDLTVSGPGITRADSQLIQGRLLHRWTGTVPAGGVVRIRLPGPAHTPGRILAALVAGMALVLGGAGWRLLRRRPAIPPGPSPDTLLEAVAALEARYAGREAETAAEEWALYLGERARLKGELEASLAGGRRDR